MNTRRDPDRMVHAFLRDGAEQLSDQVYDAVRAEIEHKRQRVVIGPWRMPTLNTYAKPAAAAVAVIAIGALGLATLRPGTSPGVGGGPTASPSASPPQSASPSATPSAAPSGPATALTETFTSEQHGFSIKYPTGWATRPATEPWTTSVPDFGATAGDLIHDPVQPDGSLWISVASQPIGESTSEAWAVRTIALDDGCRTTRPITIDGAAGRIGGGDCARATVTIDGRGYFFWLYTAGDVPSVPGAYDQAWFQEVLATVQLLPEDAVDAPSETP